MTPTKETRRAEREAEIAFNAARAAETNMQIIRRYCDEQRQIAAANLKSLQEAKTRDEQIADYVARYGNDLG